MTTQTKGSVQSQLSPGLRFSHAVLAAAVLHQLVSSEWMAKPWKPTAAGSWPMQLFEWHETVGLAATTMLVALLVILWRRSGGELFFRYMPWLSGVGRSAIALELQRAFSGFRALNPPSAEQTATLARAIQGLGLLLLVFLASTGVLMWAVSDNPALMHDIGELHELGALPLKLYLLGHAGMALVHEWRGEGLIRRMFSLRGN